MIDEKEKRNAVLEEFSDVWKETCGQLNAMAHEIVSLRGVRDYWFKRAERAEAVVTELNARIERAHDALSPLGRRKYGEGEV